MADSRLAEVALVALLYTIPRGVQTLVISESCHAGGMLEPAFGSPLRDPYIFISACAADEPVPVFQRGKDSSSAQFVKQPPFCPSGGIGRGIRVTDHASDRRGPASANGRLQRSSALTCDSSRRRRPGRGM